MLLSSSRLQPTSDDILGKFDTNGAYIKIITRKWHIQLCVISHDIPKLFWKWSSKKVHRIGLDGFVALNQFQVLVTCGIV